MGRSRLGDAIHAGYLKAARTLTCPYCWEVRSIDNIHQTTPRVKCKPCHQKRRRQKR